jgi:hypothetical protein
MATVTTSIRDTVWRNSAIRQPEIPEKLLVDSPYYPTLDLSVIPIHPKLVEYTKDLLPIYASLHYGNQELLKVGGKHIDMVNGRIAFAESQEEVLPFYYNTYYDMRVKITFAKDNFLCQEPCTFGWSFRGTSENLLANQPKYEESCFEEWSGCKNAIFIERGTIGILFKSI